MIGSVNAWWYIIPPLVAALASVVAILIALRPLIRERSQREDERRQREARWDSTADAVWGRAADSRRGVAKITGLLETANSTHEIVEKLEEKVRDVQATVNKIKDGRA